MPYNEIYNYKIIFVFRNDNNVLRIQLNCNYFLNIILFIHKCIKHIWIIFITFYFFLEAIYMRTLFCFHNHRELIYHRVLEESLFFFLFIEDDSYILMLYSLVIIHVCNFITIMYSRNIWSIGLREKMLI